MNSIKINKNDDEVTSNLTLTEKDNILLALSNLNLPVEGILSDIKNRKIVLHNLDEIISRLPKTNEAYYLSKFVVAVYAGLFDSALNYLWNETIKQLRERVLVGNLNYFYDVAISDGRRKLFSSPEHLTNLDDKTLIQGAFNVGLIERVGYQYLEHIRFMRNYASAAHPNEIELTSYNLIAWLDICIREVIAKPISSIQVHINEILSNIKKESFTEDDIKKMASFFSELTQQNCDSFAKGLFGIYIDKDSNKETIRNINSLAPKLWKFVSEKTRKEFGVRNAIYSANGKKYEADNSEKFLKLVKGSSYLTNNVKISLIKNAIDNLLNAHNSFNNFYSEPPLANELTSLVGEHGIPNELEYIYIESLVTLFLTNGNGVTWNANSIYVDLIKKLNEKQSYLALTSFKNEDIKNKLQFDLCKKKFKEMIDLLKLNIISENMRLLLDDICKEINNLSKLTCSSWLMEKIYNLDKKLKI